MPSSMVVKILVKVLMSFSVDTLSLKYWWYNQGQLYSKDLGRDLELERNIKEASTSSMYVKEWGEWGHVGECVDKQR